MLSYLSTVLELIFLKKPYVIVDGHLSTINVATRYYALTVPKCHQEVSVRFLQRKTAVFSQMM